MKKSQLYRILLTYPSYFDSWKHIWLSKCSQIVICEEEYLPCLYLVISAIKTILIEQKCVLTQKYSAATYEDKAWLIPKQTH